MDGYTLFANKLGLCLKVACKIIRKSHEFGNDPEESLNKLPIEEIDKISG